MNNQTHLLRGLNFFFFATQSILLPLLPLYFALRGFTNQEIGLFMMIGPFVAVFAQPMWGYLSDRLQSIKWIIFTLWSLTIASSFGLFFAAGYSATLLFVLLLYFFMLPATPLLDSLNIRMAMERGLSYGSIRMWGSVGFLLLAAGTGSLLPLFGGVANIGVMYWLLWIVPMILMLFLKDKPAAGPRLTWASMKAVFHNRTFLWFLVMVFLITIPHRMNDALFGLYLQSLGASPGMISLAWALAAAGEIPTFALLGRYMNRYHELAVLGLVSVLYTIRWLLYAYIHDPWVLVFLQLTHSVTYAVFWLVAVQYAVRLIPEELRSTGQALLSAVFLGLAGITGGFVGGWFQDQYGGTGMYLFGTVLTAISAVLFLVTHARQRKK